jgi:hypothetical protein
MMNALASKIVIAGSPIVVIVSLFAVEILVISSAAHDGAVHCYCTILCKRGDMCTTKAARRGGKPALNADRRRDEELSFGRPSEE